MMLQPYIFAIFLVIFIPTFCATYWQRDKHFGMMFGFGLGWSAGCMTIIALRLYG